VVTPLDTKQLHAHIPRRIAGPRKAKSHISYNIIERKKNSRNQNGRNQMHISWMMLLIENRLKSNNFKSLELIENRLKSNNLKSIETN